VCGLGAGALPLSSPAEHARLGLIAVYSGLTLMLLGWWWYSRGDGGTRNAYVTLTLWTAPLLLAPPMFSRDVYSYLAQGLMIDAGVDVYQNGQECDAVVDTHLVAGVLAMRLVAVAGLTLLAAAVPVLARSTGIRPATALWLAALNPLVLIHLVGGAHNDALTVGLLAAGLAAAVRHRPVVATLLVVGAALVKAPAALGLCAALTSMSRSTSWDTSSGHGWRSTGEPDSG
jgi:alpha-1,6-mannosyltransferase